jgi:hypothetical protein
MRMDYKPLLGCAYKIKRTAGDKRNTRSGRRGEDSDVIGSDDLYLVDFALQETGCCLNPDFIA